MLNFKTAVSDAKSRINSYVRETPLEYSASLSKITQTKLYLKCENLQYTRSFKVRGAFNKILSLSAQQRAQGIVTASTGNHGAAVAFCLAKLNMAGTIFVPEHVSPVKEANIRNYSDSLRHYGHDSVLTELHALDYAKNQHLPYISPYNDELIISGQGTIGLELTQQLDKVDAVFVPVGGGGLIAGIAGFVKAVSPHTQVIACLPENSPVMFESIKAGKIITMDSKPTLSDATAGGIEPDSITFAMCQQYVDDYVLVSEREIQEAIIALVTHERLLVEGASGVALASLFKSAGRFKNKNIAIVLSGGNISLPTLKSLL
ncbi:threonine/serine dehydratase [Legionella sp. km772]|uniref:threonine/serine dehydratase n=1 Tax=Legionella sp. km772 TaxID=2498111 RepID=UPI000F8ED1CB|nr:threonine/serine dehydratase [Legionella sp. km772]RUR13825.1 threonine/serine dehydratase [Legionella sp. km772]